MKRLFKIFKFYDYIILLVVLGLILLQTYFEMEFIGFTQEMLSLVGVSADTKAYLNVGYKMVGVALIILASIIIKNILTSFFSSRISK